MSEEWNNNTNNPMMITMNMMNNLMNGKKKHIKKQTITTKKKKITMEMEKKKKKKKAMKKIKRLSRADGATPEHSLSGGRAVKHTTNVSTRKNIGSRCTVFIVATAASILPTTANTRKKNVFGGGGIIIIIDFQAMLFGEPTVVEFFAALRKAVVTRNPKSMIRLYSTGGFYFTLTYPASNLLSIARLFSVTHVHQAFHGVEEAALSSSLPLAKRSVLGAGLPASLLYVLERSGAAAMVSDSDTPEIVWTHKMRAENPIPQVLQHHGDFPQKLSQLCHSLYDYAPMPPVTYPELRDEMWCHCYYLRNLCDEIRFSNWPTVKHVESLQSLPVFRREELTRRPMNFFKGEACKTLEISLEDVSRDDFNKSGSLEMAEGITNISKQIENMDEEKLKQQYRKLPMTYHPDKNPEGREKFLAIQKAYKRLQIIWISSACVELLKFVDQQRANQGPDGSYNLKHSHASVYNALSKELYVGNVCLRVYNDQPDFKTSEPEAFCLALLDFISCLVRNQTAKESDAQSKSSLSHSPNTSELQSGTDDGSIHVHHVSDDSLPITDVKVTAKEDFDLIKNLRFGVNSLQNLLTSDPNWRSVFSSNEQLLPLFECFSTSGASESNIPQLCSSALSLLTAYAPCLEAMVADGSSLLLLLQMLHSAPSCHEGALHVLCALASTPQLTWAASKHGGVVYILELLMPLQEEIPLQQRAAAASLLGKLVGQPIHGPRVAITLARFIPDGLVSVIDWPGEAVVSSLEQTTETIELVWTPAIAASMSAQMATLASDLYLEQMKGRIVESDIPEQCQQEMRDEPQVWNAWHDISSLQMHNLLLLGLLDLLLLLGLLDLQLPHHTLVLVRLPASIHQIQTESGIK